MHSQLFSTAVRVAILQCGLADATQRKHSEKGRRRSPRQQAQDDHDKVFKLFSSRAACERVVGWALHRALGSKQFRGGKPLPFSNLLGLLVKGKEDGSHRRCFDDDLLGSLRIGQVCVPQSGLVDCFVRLQEQLIERVKKSNDVIRGGPFVVQSWLDHVRYDRAAWADFLTACNGSGLEQALEHSSNGPVTEQARSGAHEQLRQVMGVLVVKYVHATLVELLRHTGLLAVKDRAEGQALRDERRGDAGRAGKGGSGRSRTKATGIANGKAPARRRTAAKVAPGGAAASDVATAAPTANKDEESGEEGGEEDLDEDEEEQRRLTARLPHPRPTKTRRAARRAGRRTWTRTRRSSGV